MTFGIQHPARDDLFDNGAREWGPLSQAKIYASEVIAAYFTEPGDRIIPKPDEQPIHPITKTT
jgi:hypothetical protein